MILAGNKQNTSCWTKSGKRCGPMLLKCPGTLQTCSQMPNFSLQGWESVLGPVWPGLGSCPCCDHPQGPPWSCWTAVSLDILIVPSSANTIQLVVSVCCGFREHTLVHTTCKRALGYICVWIYRCAFLWSRIHLFVYERAWIGVCLYEFMDMCNSVPSPKGLKAALKTICG